MDFNVHVKNARGSLRVEFCAQWGNPRLLGDDTVLYKYIEENLQKRPNYTLKRCLAYADKGQFAGVMLSQITPSWVEQFQRYLREETGLSQGTASLYASALRRQLRLAVRDGLIAKNPAEFARNIPMPQSKKQPLSFEQLKRLAKTPLGGNLGAQVKRAFLFCCFTGLRVSDLRGLKWNMLCRRMDGSVWICKRQKKTGGFVYIPLHKCALCLAKFRERLQDQNYLQGQDARLDEFVFPLLALTKTNTDQYLKKWGRAAGIEHLSWHTARHTMATLALENGAELRTVSELLGHTNISTTLRYAKATDSLKQSAIAALPPL